ncbi:MAG TPA: hypothetical protein VGH38_28765 [Bryobacteraceae bacterium]
MRKFLEFDSAHEAGTGGWVFTDAATGLAYIMPEGMTPSSVFGHPLFHPRAGALS